MRLHLLAGMARPGPERSRTARRHGGRLERGDRRLTDAVSDLETANSIETFFIERAKQLLKAALETESPGIFIYRADAQAAYDKLNKP